MAPQPVEEPPDLRIEPVRLENVYGPAGCDGFSDHIDGISRHDDGVGQGQHLVIGIVARPVPLKRPSPRQDGGDPFAQRGRREAVTMIPAPLEASVPKPAHSASTSGRVNATSFEGPPTRTATRGLLKARISERAFARATPR